MELSGHVVVLQNATNSTEPLLQETIPFNRPFATGQEYEYIRQAIASGQISGDGPFTKRCQRLFEETLGVRKVLLTTSCTDALELSALLLDLQPGDEIVVPSFTFVSTVNAFVLRGARPVFADIRPDTLNLDETQLESLISPRTKAIVVVHYAGVGCEMDTISAIARHHGIPVVEDNAHGLFGSYRGRRLGTLGRFATLSFHETKNSSCGEGGALLINDAADIEHAEILREKGTNRSRFFRGQVDNTLGLTSDQASCPLTFLPHSSTLSLSLVNLFNPSAAVSDLEFLLVRIACVGREFGVRLPTVPGHCEQAYQTPKCSNLLMPSEKLRDAFISHLRRSGITSVFHYLPLHLSEMGRRWAARQACCPITVDVSGRLVRLPFFNSLHDGDQSRVIEAACEFHDF